MSIDKEDQEKLDELVLMMRPPADEACAREQIYRAFGLGQAAQRRDVHAILDRALAESKP